MDRASARTSFGLSAASPVVLMIAADLTQVHKGIDLGIRALKNVDPAQNVQVLLLGQAAEPIRRALRPLRSVSAFAREDETLARAYRAADLTVIPSLWENFPYVALESLACGTPLVAFPINGMTEIIGNNERGRVCTSIDAQELSRNISELLSDDALRSAMGANGIEWVKANCGMAEYLKKIVEIYSEVTG